MLISIVIYHQYLTVKGIVNPEPFRELLAGVKQQGNGIELALELPSEIYSRTGRKPIVIRAGYRYD